MQLRIKSIKNFAIQDETHFMKTSQFRTKHIKIEAFQCQFAVAFRKWENISEEPTNVELVNVFPDKPALKKLLHKNVRGEWFELFIQSSCQHLDCISSH